MTANVHTEAKVPRIPQSESFRPVPRVSAVRVPSPGATVWLGVAVTAALFEIGKLLIGLYIGKQALESTYGRAAAFVVLLIWVYYSSQLVLMGAEFTRIYAAPRPWKCFASKSDQVPRPRC
jgi:uncharacterized BrkB/YihY/UPF0761 family membrane protein